MIQLERRIERAENLEAEAGGGGRRIFIHNDEEPGVYREGAARLTLDEVECIQAQGVDVTIIQVIHTDAGGE